ncbi:MAG: hypothetical protein KC431_13635 [Myxococcales bacterium]|nr:hypothetical protein [Myxococcales bacterium]
MFTRRPVLSVILLTAGFAASACTAILVPDEKDDGVTRCNNTDDCKQPDDNRWRSLCVYGENQADNSDKVCAPDFQEINCNPQAYGGDHPYPLLYEEAIDSGAKAMYGACDPMKGCVPGSRGTPPDGGSCAAGLEPRAADGICDEPGTTDPAIYVPALEVDVDDIVGQDVLDQFCRGYFCDETFVCDTSKSKWTCKPCTGDDPADFGSGGCGTLYLQGAPSSAYSPGIVGANCEGMITSEDLPYGTAPAVP